MCKNNVLTREKAWSSKHIQKIGNSKGIVIDKPVLDLLHVEENGAFEVTQEKDGLFLKPLTASQAYRKVAKRHRKSLDKLAKWISIRNFFAPTMRCIFMRKKSGARGAQTWNACEKSS